jgi:hypothetical protein
LFINNKPENASAWRLDHYITSAKGLLSSFKEVRLGREETTMPGHFFILLLDKIKVCKKKVEQKNRIRLKPLYT